jgi:hypothetical protein
MRSSSSGVTPPSKSVDEKDEIAVPTASRNVRCATFGIKLSKSYHLLHDILVWPQDRLHQMSMVFLCILQETHTREPFWEISYYKSLEHAFIPKGI